MQKNSYLFVKFGNQFRKAIYVWEKQSKTDQVFKKKKTHFLSNHSKPVETRWRRRGPSYRRRRRWKRKTR